MRTTLAAAVLGVFTLVGCRSAEVATGAPVPEWDDAQPAAGDANTVPMGTQFVVELDETIDTDQSEVGDRFTATVKDAVELNGRTMIPAGAKVHGVITGLDDSDDVGDQAAIRLNLESIEIEGDSHPLRADITEADVELENVADVEDIAKRAGVGAAAGAVLGAIISGGELKDILVGGALGAGAGTIISLGLGDVDAALPRGTDLTLRTVQPIDLR